MNNSGIRIATGRGLSRAAVVLVLMSLVMTAFAGLGDRAASAAPVGTTGLSTSDAAANPPGTAYESCLSYLAGANDPRVNLSADHTTAGPGDTVNYQVSLTPPAASDYNVRACIYVADGSGNYVSTLAQGEFNPVTVPSYATDFPFSYQVPTSGLTNGTQICAVAKTQGGGVNGANVKDRKSALVCFTYTAPVLTVSKAPGPSPISIGGTAKFFITATNAGPGTATGYILTDTLPDLNVVGGSWSDKNLTTTGGAGTPTCSILTGVLSCTPVIVPANGSISIEVDDAGTTAAGTLTNSATVSATNASSVTSLPASVQVVAKAPANSPQLTLAKAAGPTPINTGQTASFTITGGNTGNATATSVVLTDSLPTGAGGTWTVGSVSPAAGLGSPVCQPVTNNTLSCTVSSLTVGGSFSVQVLDTGTTTAATLTNAASVTASNASPVPSNQAVVVVQSPSLWIHKTAVTTPITVGGTASFLISAGNSGPGDATNFDLTDSLPSSAGGTWTAQPVQSTGTPGVNVTCTLTGQKLDCPIATLPAGSSFDVEVDDTGTVHVGSLNNTANATADHATPVTSADTVTIVPIVVAPVGPPSPAGPSTTTLSLTKAADSTSVAAGSQIGYTITVTNTGGNTANNAKISDPLPSATGVSWSVDAGGTTASNCTISGTTLSCGPQNLAPGTSEVVHLISPTTAGSCGPLSNTATATADNATNPASGSAALAVVCAGDPALQVTKTADSTQVGQNGTVGFAITVANIGGAAAPNVSLQDPLPTVDGLTWTINQEPTAPATCAITGGTLTCTDATLAANASFGVHIVSSAVPTTCTVPTVPNTATATDGKGDSAAGHAQANLTCVLGTTVEAAGLPPTTTASAPAASGPAAVAPASSSLPVAPVTASAPAAQLPFTGFRANLLLLLAGLSMALGLGLLLLSRRPRLATVKIEE